MEKTALHKTPIVLVPGMAFDYPMLIWRFFLEEAGFNVEIAELYRLVALKTIDEQAHLVSEKIDRVLKKYNSRKCHLIGYSLGTVTSLYYIQKMTGGEKVDKCICVTPPFNGIRDYLMLLEPIGFFIKSFWDIFPDSKFLEEMRRGKTGGAEISIVCGAKDWMCALGANFPFVKKIFVTDGGHIAIYFGLNKEAREAVLKILSGDKKNHLAG